MSEGCEIGRGVRQGCPLSFTLFNTYLEDLVKNCFQNMGGVKVGEKRIKCIRFADDMALLAEEETILRDMLLELKDSCEQYGMKINANKTKIMIFARKMKKVNLRIVNEAIEQVDVFKYLSGNILSLERHFNTFHSKYQLDFPRNSEVRKHQLQEFIFKLSTRQNLFVKPSLRSKAATIASFKFDEFTDINDTIQIIDFMRTDFSDFMSKEEIFSMIPLKGIPIALDIFNIFKNVVDKLKTPLFKLVSITANGVKSINGHVKSFIALCRKDYDFQDFLSYHCIIYPLNTSLLCICKVCAMEVPWVSLLNMNDAFRTESYHIEEYLLSMVLDERLADEPREFNLPTFPQRRIAYVQEKLPGKYGVHSEEYVP
ncbi:hypothetical protein ANN_13692 [Periplaneta americana]|uniref:Reverse transcriptase domain-containing protein n=1 Tax=Periplaneta americana TaxID=6978 RepID=A0ABQ8SU84_PERAM|nr:hypothetical protein ANN_13692 [Periplaneta americana]